MTTRNLAAPVRARLLNKARVELRTTLMFLFHETYGD